jgi:hypothetical protein
MLAFIKTKRLTLTSLLVGCILLVSGCANHQGFASEQNGINPTCPGVEHDDDQCSAHRAFAEYKREVHEEYYEQILPIHERKEVIEQEIEDARKKKLKN